MPEFFPYIFFYDEHAQNQKKNVNFPVKLRGKFGIILFFFWSRWLLERFFKKSLE